MGDETLKSTRASRCWLSGQRHRRRRSCRGELGRFVSSHSLGYCVPKRVWHARECRRTFALLDLGHGCDVVLDVLEFLLLRGQYLVKDFE
jgi:hypothetical protein